MISDFAAAFLIYHWLAAEIPSQWQERHYFESTPQKAKVWKPSDIPAFAKTSKNFLGSMRGQQEDIGNLLFVIKIVAVDADRAVCDSQYQHCETVKDCSCFAQP